MKDEGNETEGGTEELRERGELKESEKEEREGGREGRRRKQKWGKGN